MSETKGKIYLIPTVLAPDTQDKVLPEYNKQIIANINYFFVENERTARRFISSLKIGVNIDTLNLYLLDKDSSRANVESDFLNIPSEADIGLISEAGCPGIADPGAMLVFLGHQQNREIIPLIGPSSILLALISSGFSGQSFTFHGYLPINKEDRVGAIQKIQSQVLKKGDTHIFMETPFRNDSLLEDILATCNNDMFLSISANITGEKQYSGTRMVKQWRNNKPVLHKIPAVFLIGMPQI